MANKIKLKLVGAERYISPMTDNNVIEKGQLAEVSEEHAEEMLKESYFDALNNEHPLWVAATEEDSKPKVAARVARTAKGKQADAAEGDSDE